MTPQETHDLAKATCGWLAYKDLTGFQRMLSEATLTLPIAEFLTAKTAWNLQSELFYQKLPGAKELPEFWCDFAATRKGGSSEVQFILEAKYLKKKVENMRRQIAADFVRLSLPPGKRLKRYFLLAGDDQFFPKKDTNFLFDKNLFRMNVNNGCYIRPRDELTKAHLLKFSENFSKETGGAAWSKIPTSAYVTCRAVAESSGEGDRKYKVIIWSIGVTKG